MKKILCLLAVALMGLTAAFAQTVTLTFTAKDAGNQYVRLNRVVITNLTKSWQEIIYWPDTLLSMQNGTGIDEHMSANDKFALSQNNPNPFSSTTEVNLSVANEGDVIMDIADLNGRIVGSYNFLPPPGIHQFRIALASAGTYVMTARQNGQVSSIKMVCNRGGGFNSLNYLGVVQKYTVVLKSTTDRPFNFGDMMEYAGFATINGAELESQRITQAQGSSQTFTLLFDATQHQLPAVITIAASDIAVTSAICGGNVTSDGGANVTARGVCWSTSQNPTVSDSHTTDGTGTGSFTSSLTGLTAGTTYYIRAYATNSEGTAYGNELNFTTIAEQPTVITTAVSGVTVTSAICGGNVTSDGGANVIARGVCWSTSQNPTVSDSHTTDGTGTGSFTSSLTGLTAGTTYYIRAYATNSEGTAYGNELDFITAALPAVTTTAVSGITGTTAICGGNVTDDGGANVTARGICWSTSHNPTLNDNHTTDSGGMGAFTSNITGLTANTTYYVRAYATNAWGTTYGNELNFTTATLPAVTTTAVTDIALISATCGGNVTSDGGVNVTGRGVCWSTSQNPTVSDSHTTDGTGTGSFTSSLTGLTAGTTYYVRAYATNSVGTVYGNELNFTTAALPTVTTIAVSGITDSTAVCGGNVTDDGGANVTARGICWSTSLNPTLNDSHTTDSGGTGAFTSNITGLTANTTYYVRAYATNTWGTSYGNEVSFVTTGPFVCGISFVIDFDGNMYNTVQIGEQCWMRENMRATHYANGTSVSGYYNYSSSSLPLAQRGYLYNWDAAMNGAGSTNSNPSRVQGICPDDWHMPSYAEWGQMFAYVKGQSQYQCNGNSSYVAKALSSTTGWNSSSSTCAVGNAQENNNATGFSIYPSGRYNSYGSYENSGKYANFWTATAYGASEAYHYWLGYSDASVSTSSYNDKITGHSVRCVRNTFPTVITTAASGITDTTAICGGIVTSDAGSAVTARGVCWSTSPNPTVTGNHTIEGGGVGSFTSNLTGLSASTVYYVRAYATNNAGTEYGNEISFATTGPFVCGASAISDYDGNAYGTVQIGNQCWTRENLRTAHYANGVSIPAGNSTGTTAFYYDNSSSSQPLAQRGYLYNWAAVMNGTVSSTANPSRVQGVCPTNWHVPSHAEWTQLTDYVSSQTQYRCSNSNNYYKIAKSLSSKTGWATYTGIYECAVAYSPGSNNATGFSAFPAGGIGSGGYADSGTEAYFWSATDYSSSNAIIRTLRYDIEGVDNSNVSKSLGLSVRCILNPLPTLSILSMISTSDSVAVTSCSVTDDGGSPVTARGVCWSTSHNPTTNDSHTVDGAGLGGFTSTLMGLNAHTTYYVRAYAVSGVGTVYGEERAFTTSFKCGVSDMTDVDGNIYGTIKIGNQCWMRENLRVEHYSDGTPINPGSTTSSTVAYYYPTQGDITNGLLYNWKAVARNSSGSSANPSGVQGVCPSGWHVPSNAEWNELIQYVSSSSQYWCGQNNANIAKAFSSAIGWETRSTSCVVGCSQENNNATGFSAMPAGVYENGYTNYGRIARFWSTNSYIYGFNYASTQVHNTSTYSYYAYSVRCIYDVSCNVGTTELPTISPVSVNFTTDTTATAACRVIDDGGSPVIVRGVCWSTSPNPTIADNHTIDSAGLGSFACTLSGLTANNTYYVRGYAANSTGMAYGREVTFTQPIPFVCGSSIMTDIDSNVYNTVQIGNQCWMKENLRTSKYPNGTTIDTYYPVSNDPEYGFLYARSTVMAGAESSDANPSGIQGVCPDGWHVPSNAEWNQLGDYVSSQSQYVCGNNNSNIAKALASAIGWNSSTNTCAIGNTPFSNNATGFSVLPAGYNDDGYYNFGSSAYIWSTTSNHTSTPFYCVVWDYQSGEVVFNTISSIGISSRYNSVRCVRDEGVSNTSQLPIITTASVSNITTTSAICGGDVISDGGYAVTARGVCWSTSPNPTIVNSHTIDGNGTGSFTSNIAIQTMNAVYYVRAYATNSEGTAYGEEVCFAQLPTVTTTTAASGVTDTSAICGGIVTSDGGATVTARGVCWSTSPNPTIANNHTSDGTGMGHFTSNITGLTVNTTYYARAYASNMSGIAYGEDMTFTTSVYGQPCTGADTVADIDGNVYGTVQIGNQCWMKENLRTTHYADGTAIASGIGTTTTACYFDYSSSNVPLELRGYLYNWSAVMNGASSSTNNPSGVQGICPNGWHVPSNGEWTQLTNYVSGQSQYLCDNNNTNIAKALSSNTGWNTSTNTCAVGNTLGSNNTTGFSAIPAGYYTGEYNNIGTDAIFWSATGYSSSYTYIRNINYNYANLTNTNYFYSTYGFSVRCVRD